MNGREWRPDLEEIRAVGGTKWVVHPVGTLDDLLRTLFDDEAPRFGQCRTPYSQPVCSCGAYRISWPAP